MKIRDIVIESIADQLDNLAPQAEIDLLDSDADNAVEQAVIDACRELIGQGHTDVEPMVLTNMVVSATGKPFLIKDLVAVNNRSEEIQHYIDSINPSKVKFSTDILTVKNEDPAKEKEKSAAGVSNMAKRAANRNRLGESVVTELDNGPKGTYSDNINYGVAKDAAKIDYSNYGAEAGEYNRQQKLQRAAQTLANRERVRAESQPNYQSIMFKIDTAIGDVFPDGDPFDYLQSKYRGVDIDVLNKAVRATKNGRNFYDYVKKVWQQHIDDNPEFGENPW